MYIAKICGKRVYCTLVHNTDMVIFGAQEVASGKQLC